MKVLMWTIILNRLNNNELLQITSNRALFLDIYVMCLRGKETHNHLFFHVRWLENYGQGCLTYIAYLGQYLPPLKCFMNSSVGGVGVCKKAKPFWQGALFTGLWTIWLEKNHRVFGNWYFQDAILWAKTTFLVSLWARAHGTFSNISLIFLHRDWKEIS